MEEQSTPIDTQVDMYEIEAACAPLKAIERAVWKRFDARQEAAMDDRKQERKHAVQSSIYSWFVRSGLR